MFGKVKMSFNLSPHFKTSSLCFFFILVAAFTSPSLTLSTHRVPPFSHTKTPISEARTMFLPLSPCHLGPFFSLLVILTMLSLATKELGKSAMTEEQGSKAEAAQEEKIHSRKGQRVKHKAQRSKSSSMQEAMLRKRKERVSEPSTK